MAVTLGLRPYTIIVLEGYFATLSTLFMHSNKHFGATECHNPNDAAGYETGYKENKIRFVRA